MVALSYESAKSIAIAVVIGLVVVAVISAKAAASMAKKVLFVIVFGGLAVFVWSQRQALQTCADKVRSGTGTTCKFLGSDVDVSSILPDH